MEVDPQQLKAIEHGSDVRRRMVAITGAAGTGKTTLLKLMYENLNAQGYNVEVAAPTGKAARRIKEATGLPAQTIHALLEFSDPGTPDKRGKPTKISFPQRDAYNPLNCDVVIVDEYAMVPHKLHNQLIAAMPPGCLFRVSGDANQLAPIEEEQFTDRDSPFVTLIKDFDGIVLDVIHRQGKGSGIAMNGMRILAGSMPRQEDDFRLCLTEDLMHELLQRVVNDEALGIDYSHLTNQILSPSYRGKQGVTAINKVLQEYYQRGTPEKDRVYMDLPRWGDDEKLRVYIGDKIICTKNNDDLLVSNGDTGLIADFDFDARNPGVIINFGEGRLITFPHAQMVFSIAKKATLRFDSRKSLELAYCVTTHKAQGSEYQHVIYVLNDAAWVLRSRRNFYTAVTRARKGVAVFSTSRSLQFALHNTKEAVQYKPKPKFKRS